MFAILLFNNYSGLSIGQHYISISLPRSVCISLPIFVVRIYGSQVRTMVLLYKDTLHHKGTQLSQREHCHSCMGKKCKAELGNVAKCMFCWG